MQRKIILLLMLCIWQICGAAETKSADELEKLFDAGQYEEFFKVARPMATQGDVGALFLLGKAYHLGKGVDADPEQARHFYNQAAKQNSARAEHNLGVMDSDVEHRPDLALAHFNRALELGLKLPTLYNVAKVHMDRCSPQGDEESCILAGGSFLQAWKIERKNDALDSAVLAYATACGINGQRLAVRGHQKDQLEVADGCREAIEWAEKGAELGLARATFNRGAVEFNVQRYAEALPWFRLANERGLGLAAYTLGLMQEKGLGLPQDEAAAREWFKRGAELKDKQSILRMHRYWEEEISYSSDPVRIKAIMEEWSKHQPLLPPPLEASEKLQMIETLASNARHFPSLAKESVPARFCPENELLYRNTEWRIFAVSKLEDTLDIADRLPLLGRGMIDANGCLTLTATAQMKLRQALSKGATPMLNWPGQRRLISVTRSPGSDLRLKIGLAVSR